MPLLRVFTQVTHAQIAFFNVFSPTYRQKPSSPLVKGEKSQRQRTLLQILQVEIVGGEHIELLPTILLRHQGNLSTLRIKLTTEDYLQEINIRLFLKVADFEYS